MGKQKNRKRKRDQRERENARLRRDRLKEFNGSFVEEYERIKSQATFRHRSLLDIFECDDVVFYDMDTPARLDHFGQGHLTLVEYDLTDDIDFANDPSSDGDRVNMKQQRRRGTSVTGFTSVVSDGTNMSTVIFMRRSTGDDSNPEGIAAQKIPAILHELGHVTDFESGRNYRHPKLSIVPAEAFAHHHTCKALIKGGYRLSLGYYLDSLAEMAESSSEHVSRAAQEVLESKECRMYRRNVSIHYSTK